MQILVQRLQNKSNTKILPIKNKSGGTSRHGQQKGHIFLHKQIQLISDKKPKKKECVQTQRQQQTVHPKQN